MGTFDVRCAKLLAKFNFHISSPVGKWIFYFGAKFTWDEETFSAISLTSQHLRICKKEGRLGSLSCFRAARTLNNLELSTYSISLFFSRTFSKIIPRTAVNLDGLRRGIYRALVQLHPCVLDVRVGRIVHFNCVLIYIPCREDVFHVLVVQDPAAVCGRPHWPKSHQHF